MNLILQRGLCDESCTIGELSVDGVFECYTLEDVVRPDGVKIPGETAIPPGCYDVDITHSPRFGCDLPLLVDVKNFSWVRIHPGNDAGDTEGCILVGQTRQPGFVGGSRKAFAALFVQLRDAAARDEPISIEVRAA